MCTHYIFRDTLRKAEMEMVPVHLMLGVWPGIPYTIKKKVIDSTNLTPKISFTLT